MSVEGMWYLRTKNDAKPFYTTDDTIIIDIDEEGHEDKFRYGKKQHDLKKTPEGFQVAIIEGSPLTLSTFNILTDVRTLKWVNQKKKKTKY